MRADDEDSSAALAQVGSEQGTELFVFEEMIIGHSTLLLLLMLLLLYGRYVFRVIF